MSAATTELHFQNNWYLFSLLGPLVHECEKQNLLLRNEFYSNFTWFFIPRRIALVQEENVSTAGGNENVENNSSNKNSFRSHLLKTSDFAPKNKTAKELTDSVVIGSTVLLTAKLYYFRNFRNKNVDESL